MTENKLSELELHGRKTHIYSGISLALLALCAWLGVLAINFLIPLALGIILVNGIVFMAIGVRESQNRMVKIMDYAADVKEGKADKQPTPAK